MTSTTFRPYIGITDFTSIEEVERMLAIVRTHGTANTRHLLHVGVMMSYKTLKGLPTKWTNAFPTKERIHEILASADAFNCLHYADYDHNPDLANCLAQAIGYGGPNLHAIQLDMPWPEAEEVRKALEIAKQTPEVILQIGKNAMEFVNDNPGSVVEMLARYEGVVTRVLLDRSMGRGLGMDAVGLLPFAFAIRERFPQMGIGAAGGLGPDSLHLVAPLAQAIDDLSIDAQGRLRPSSNALDPVDWNMAGEYLRKAIALFSCRSAG